MPELPEVEHVVRALRRVVVGRTIVATEIRLPKLIGPTSTAAFKRKLKNFRITGVSRRGKFILIELDSERILAVHLRMTGKFLYLSAENELPKHAHAIFYLDNDRRLVFRDQRQFGVMKLVARARLAKTKGIRDLAPEPLSDDFGPAYLSGILTSFVENPSVRPDQSSRPRQHLRRRSFVSRAYQSVQDRRPAFIAKSRAFASSNSRGFTRCHHR